MKPAANDFESIKLAVKNNDMNMVKKHIEQFGRSIVNNEYSEYSKQEIYPEYYRYYLIPIAIQIHNLEIIKLLISSGASLNLEYMFESDFNSRADQYMHVQKYSIIGRANKCGATKEIITFLQEYKKK